MKSRLQQWMSSLDRERDLEEELGRAKAENLQLHQRLALLEGRSRSAKPRTHLVIGDAHADPSASNDRFTWLGRLIADVRPDVVVDIGDWATMGSLYDGDWGKMRGEGKRLADDISVAVEARQMVAKEMRGMKQPPRLYSTLGNHEDRLMRIVERQPHLSGTLDMDALGHKKYKWRRVPFLVPLLLDGVVYQHYFTSNGGRAVSSEKHHAASLLDKGLVSCVAGHSHRYDHSIRRRWDGGQAMALVAGCYFEHTEPWAGPDNATWDRGILILRDVSDGYGHPEWRSMDSIRRTYSDDGG